MKLLIFSLLITTQISLIFASFLQVPFRCYQGDNDCMTSLAQTITPALLQRLPDPLNFDFLQIKDENMQLDMTDVKIYGLNKLAIQYMSLDPLTNMTRTIFRTNVLANAFYKLNGSMFSIPIFGDGDILFDHRNVEVEVLTQYDLIKGVDGYSYASAKGYQFRYDVKDFSIVRGTNLYNGNKELSEYMFYLFDQNWKVMTEMFGRQYFRAILDKMFYPFRAYLLSEPLNNLILR